MPASDSPLRGLGISAAAEEIYRELLPRDQATVTDLCAAAKKPELAARFVAANTELDAIREQLTADKAAAEPEVVTTLPALSAAKPTRVNPLDPQAIYSNRR